MPLRRGLLRRVTATISLIVVADTKIAGIIPTDGLETELESWLFVKVEIHSSLVIMIPW